MPQDNKLNDFYVVTISSIEEREILHEFCVKHNIPIPYPNLFEEKELHHLWGMDKNGVGLVGTIVAMHTPKDHIINVQKLGNEE